MVAGKHLRAIEEDSSDGRCCRHVLRKIRQQEPEQFHDLLIHGEDPGAARDDPRFMVGRTVADDIHTGQGAVNG